MNTTTHESKPVAAGVSPAVEPGVPPGGTGHENFNATENSLPSQGGKMPPSTADETSASAIDTSKMSAGQRAAIELTEAAREQVHESSFVADLFMGRMRFDKLVPVAAGVSPALEGWHPAPRTEPQEHLGRPFFSRLFRRAGRHGSTAGGTPAATWQTHEDRDQGDAFLQRLEKILHEQVDPDAIDRTGEIPDEVILSLASIGAFAIKVPTQYGGLGLSQTNYCRAAMMLGGYCGNLTALISAHQSIGVPQPLILFGTEEQKCKYLPRFGRGEISAFALTENGVGSDPARMQTRAEPTPDGEAFVLNGEKLWCTNGTRAGVIVVMAKTPPKLINGVSKDQVTAFIVEMDSPGVEVVRRCRFMGLRALYNGVIRFTDVRVPRENILLGEGKGLRVALTTLNTGRLTLPAACVGLSKRCLEISTRWAARREQWGAPIGKHAFIADKLARMAADTFAMESMTLYAASLVDKDKHADVRLEAALGKLWGTETAWRIVNDTMQIRGGRGYETADSQRARGEEAEPVERFMRDCRINTIFEGSSEIMRLFIAREALDPHLKVAGAIFNSKLPAKTRLAAAVKAGMFYARWYPGLFVPKFKVQSSKFKVDRSLRGHLRFVERSGRKLARSLFHAMALCGPKLEREQLLLGRFVDIAAELFAMTAGCARAAKMGDESSLALADYFCRTARLRVGELFRALGRNEDRSGYKLAQQMLPGAS